MHLSRNWTTTLRLFRWICRRSRLSGPLQLVSRLVVCQECHSLWRIITAWRMCARRAARKCWQTLCRHTRRRWCENWRMRVPYWSEKRIWMNLRWGRVRWIRFSGRWGIPGTRNASRVIILSRWRFIFGPAIDCLIDWSIHSFIHSEIEPLTARLIDWLVFG